MRGIILSCTVLLCFFIFKLISPVKPIKELDLARIEDNKKRFNRHEKMALLWIPLFIALICFFVWVIGTNLTTHFFSDSYVYIVKATGSYWVMNGVVLAFGLIKVPLELIYRFILKGDYDLYMQYTNLKHGYDGNKILKPIGLTFTIVGLIFFVLGLNWFIRYDGNEIEINELFELKTRTYQIENIKSISHYVELFERMSGTEKLEHYVIVMDDDYTWNGEIFGFFSDKKHDINSSERMIEISNKAGLHIQEYLIQTQRE
jgi:hypothetical protein